VKVTLAGISHAMNNVSLENQLVRFITQQQQSIHTGEIWRPGARIFRRQSVLPRRTRERHAKKILLTFPHVKKKKMYGGRSIYGNKILEI